MQAVRYQVQASCKAMERLVNVDFEGKAKVFVHRWVFNPKHGKCEAKYSFVFVAGRVRTLFVYSSIYLFGVGERDCSLLYLFCYDWR